MFQFWKYLFSSKKSDIATQNESNSVQDNAAVKNPVQEEEVKEESSVQETVEESPVQETIEESPVQEAKEETPVQEAVEETVEESPIKETVQDTVEESPVEKTVKELLVQDPAEEDNKPLDTIKEVEYESTHTEKRDERDISCDSDAITVPTINNPHPTSN